MNFRIVWEPEAEQTLMLLWLAARDRTLISEAVDSLEKQLRHNPMQVGESRDGQGEIRVAFSGPLAFMIQVDVVMRIVYVLTIRRIKRKRE